MTLDVKRLSITQIKKLLNSADNKQRREIADLLEQDKRIGIQKLLSSLKSSQQKSQQNENEFRVLCSYEIKLRNNGFNLIAGVDEAGRGAFAGPLVAAACILPSEFYLPGLKESKQLSPQMREVYYQKIIDCALDWQAEVISPSLIDEKGLHQANLYALEQAVLNLSTSPDFVLSDGFSLPNLRLPRMSLIQGDKLSISIAAASIIAKVERDRMMISYAKEFTEYGFERHKGYGTKAHIKALEEFGPSPIHRLSFKPIREYGQLEMLNPL